MKILVFDVGNTNIKMGMYDGKELKASWRLNTKTDRTTDEMGGSICQLLDKEGIKVSDIDQCAISSVVPGIMYSMVSAIRRYIGVDPIMVGPGVKTGVNVRTPNPNEVGADLICDIAAAVEQYKAPLIVVDFGTATKYLVVNEKGEFIAAVFSPGIGISAQVMTEKAAQLPGFEIKKPKSILTNTTVECMQAGIVYGYIGQVEYIVSQIRREMGIPDMKVIATGGFGNILVGEVDCFSVYDSTLALKGLRIIAEKNMDKKKGKNK